MSLIPWKGKQKQEGAGEAPPLASLKTEIDRLFESCIREPLASLEWPFGTSSGWVPVIDVSEDEQRITVRAEIPGIAPQDVEVTVCGNQLVLSGEKRESSRQSGSDFHVQESRFGAFRRVVPLPGVVEPERVEAHCVNGVLTVEVAKCRAEPARRIEVKVQNA